MWYKRKLGAYMTPPLSDIGNQFGCEGFVIYEFSIQVIGTTFQNNLLRFNPDNIQENQVFLSILQAFTKINIELIFEVILKLIEFDLLRLNDENILFSPEISDSLNPQKIGKQKDPKKVLAGKLGGKRSIESRRSKKENNSFDNEIEPENEDESYIDDSLENETSKPIKNKQEVRKSDLDPDGETFDYKKDKYYYNREEEEAKIKKEYDEMYPFPFRKHKAFPIRTDIQEVLNHFCLEHLDFIPQWYNKPLNGSAKEKKAYVFLINLAEDGFFDKFYGKEFIPENIEQMIIKLVKKKTNSSFYLSNLYDSFVNELKAWYLDCKDDPLQDELLKELAQKYKPLNNMPDLPPLFANS